MGSPLENFEAELRRRIVPWERLGRLDYPDGARSYGKIPHAGSHAYLHSIMPPPTPALVGAVEKKLGRNAPQPLLRLWQVTNGLHLFHLSLDFLGLPSQFSRDLDAPPQPFDFVQYNSYSRPRHLPNGFALCGSYGFDRSGVLVDAEGAVHVCSRDGSELVMVGGTLNQFVLAEYDRLSALFDADGRLTVPNDATVHPGIRRYH